MDSLNNVIQSKRKKGDLLTIDIGSHPDRDCDIWGIQGKGLRKLPKGVIHHPINEISY